MSKNAELKREYILRIKCHLKGHRMREFQYYVKRTHL